MKFRPLALFEKLTPIHRTVAEPPKLPRNLKYAWGIVVSLLLAGVMVAEGPAAVRWLPVVRQVLDMLASSPAQQLQAPAPAGPAAPSPVR